MSVDVSLCVVRIESTHLTEPQKEDRHVRRRQTVYRGRREPKKICVETYPLAEGDMAEAVAVKPVMDGPKENMRSKDVLHFVSGNPFVERTNGIIHLFKEDDMTGIERAAMRSQTVCILAVPATMTCSDLLAFMAPCRDAIKHVRIIKDASPNQYMALVTFRSPESVEEFYKSFNGIPFNSMEPECCHLVFVSRVETLPEEEGGSLAPVSHTELPTCPVCLERMDESVDGILTIMCNHAFHGNCLVKWGDTSCPICRYVQTPELTEENYCLECLSKDSLWICLICGHVGCGRYVQGHAYQHYRDTHHCYSMQLGSNSVWDYVGDNFVHRILQNKADGKLVASPTDADAKPVEMEVKLEAIQLEYSYLLTSQLESQRIYYEELMDKMEQKTAEETSSLRETATETMAKFNEQSARASALLKEKTALEKKLQQVTAKLNTVQKQLQEEKELNSSLRENQGQWQEKCNQIQRELTSLKVTKERELADLNEQLRDVMFFLEAQKTVSSSSLQDELKEGTIEIGPPPSTSQGKTPRRGRKHH